MINIEKPCECGAELILQKREISNTEIVLHGKCTTCGRKYRDIYSVTLIERDEDCEHYVIVSHEKPVVDGDKK